MKFKRKTHFISRCPRFIKFLKFELNSIYDYGKNKKLDMEVNTDKIEFQDLITLAKAYLDSLHIKNDLNLISGTGYLEANATLKTNLKKLVSNGKITIRNGGIINKNIKLGITKTNANVE